MLRVSQFAALRPGAIALAVVLMLPSPASAQDYFGAIAYSWETGAHGWANVYPSREAAEQTALSICSQHARDCRPAIWFRNACGALAHGPNGPGWAWETSKAAAEKKALELCAKRSTGCAVARSFCTNR